MAPVYIIFSVQVKPGDVIVRVGQTKLGIVNSHDQTLANLRELILGETGTFVALGTYYSAHDIFKCKPAWFIV